MKITFLGATGTVTGSKCLVDCGLFTPDDSEKVLKQFKSIEFEQDFNLTDDLKLRFTPSVHILGSAFVTLRSRKTSVVFSSEDLARPIV